MSEVTTNRERLSGCQVNRTLSKLNAVEGFPLLAAEDILESYDMLLERLYLDIRVLQKCIGMCCCQYRVRSMTEICLS